MESSTVNERSGGVRRRREPGSLRALVALAALVASLAGCGSTVLTAAPSEPGDNDLVRLVLLEDARQTERQCVAANGVRSADGCMASYLRRDGAIGIVAWLTRSMPVEEYRRALPLWCHSVAAAQGLSPARCESEGDETAVSAQPGMVSGAPVVLPEGPVGSGHLLTLVLGSAASVEQSSNPVTRFRVGLPTQSPDAPGWKVVAHEWCHSIAHAEWQLMGHDPCHGATDQVRVNIAPADQRLGWVPARVPCAGWVNQFCDPVTLPRNP